MGGRKMIINKPRPLFRRELKNAPGHPLGNRALVREFPPASKSEAGVDIPDSAKATYNAGILIAAGDQAADQLWDLGVEIGDEVWYAKYAGILEEWQHIVGKDNAGCPHDGAWERVAPDDRRWATTGIVPNDNVTLRECRACGTLKLTEKLIAMTGDDLCVSVDLQQRLERGEMRRERQETAEGKTRYVIVRDEKRIDTFETKGAA